MRKFICLFLGLIIFIFSLTGCSDNGKKESIINNTAPNFTSQPEQKEDSLKPSLTEDEWNFIIAGSSGLAEKRAALCDLAESVVGEENVDNIAVDNSTVKFLLTEDHPADALLIQYAILHRMNNNYDMTVKFVFYKEKGNAQTAYLRSTFNADTLATLDWNTVSILNLKDYASEYNEF